MMTNYFHCAVFSKKFNQYMQTLTQFSNDENVAYVCAKVSLLDLHSSPSHETLIMLRQQLNLLITSENENVKHSGSSLSAVSYLILLMLVQLQPDNQYCVKYWLPIEENSKIYVSTGHQYDINVLIDFINIKSSFANPYTNEPFSKWDTALIISAAKAKNIHISARISYELSEEELLELRCDISAACPFKSEETIRLEKWAEGYCLTESYNHDRRFFSQPPLEVIRAEEIRLREEETQEQNSPASHKTSLCVIS